MKLIREYRINQEVIDDSSIKGTLKSLTKHLVEFHVRNINQYASIDDLLHSMIDGLDRCAVLVKSDKDLSGYNMDILYRYGMITKIRKPKEYKYIYTLKADREKIPYLMYALDYLKLKPSDLDMSNIKDSDFIPYMELQKKASSIDWSKEKYKIKLLVKNADMMTYQITSPKTGNEKLLVIDVVHNEDGILNRVHYPHGIHPFLEGTGAFQTILMQLARDWQIISSSPVESSNASKRAWEKLKVTSDFEKFGKDDYYAILYKGAKEYEWLKEYVIENY